MGKPKRKFTDAIKRAAVDDYVSGRKSAAQVAAAHEVSVSHVYKWRTQLDEKAKGLAVEELEGEGRSRADAVLEFLESVNIESNIPLWSTKVGKSFSKEDGFHYDRHLNTMTCPMNHQMTKAKKMDQDAYLFTLSKLICGECPLKETCLSSAQKRNRRLKRVRIDRRQYLFQEVLEKERAPEFKNKLRERMWKMEGIFAEGKSHHGMRKARYRGRAKVQMQVYVVSIVQNLKRLAALAFGDLGAILRSAFLISKNSSIFFEIRLA